MKSFFPGKSLANGQHNDHEMVSAQSEIEDTISVSPKESNNKTNFAISNFEVAKPRVLSEDRSNTAENHASGHVSTGKEMPKDSLSAVFMRNK